MKKTIELMNVVNGTFLNEDGHVLFMEISKEFDNGNIVLLSLDNSTPMTSSFMNSSFGALEEKYGLEKLRSSLGLINFRPSHAQHIKNYIDSLKSCTC